MIAGDDDASKAPTHPTVEAAEVVYAGFCQEWAGCDVETETNLHLAAAAVFEAAGEWDAEMLRRRRDARHWRSELPELAQEMLG